MHAKTKTFLTLFELELDDLHQDIELLIAQYKVDHDHEVISNYVFYENIALMNNELFGIDSFREEVRKSNYMDYTDSVELVNTLKKRLLERCRDKGIASSAYILAERKMKKILAYIEHEQQVLVH